MDKDLSRRAFLTGAAATGAIAALGVAAGCAPQATGTSGSGKTTGGDTLNAFSETSLPSAGYSWEVVPDPITDIASTVETDILIIGAGLSGCACACSAAESGGKVTVVEKGATWSGRGGGFGAIKSRMMDQLGIKVDKVNAKQHWIAQNASRDNEDLIVEFFNNSETASNWMLDKIAAKGKSLMCIVGAFYSHDDVYAEQPGYHMCMCVDKSMKSSGFPGAELCYEDAVKAGAEFVFNSPAEQLVKENGKVTGCICKTDDGYVKYTAKNVVLATGDIGGNKEMCQAYAPVCVPWGFDRSQYTPQGQNTGDGQKMGMWVGGQLQDLPFPTMMHPQAFCWFHGPFLFVNSSGERFMCEDTWVQGKSLAINRQEGGCAYSIFDANWETDLVNGLPYGGGMFWDSFRAYGSDISQAPAYFETQIPTYIKGGMAYKEDTLEALAKDIGCDPSALKSTVDRYNKMCDAKEDTDYYKKPVFLTPVKTGPFYALKVGPALLTVTGGLRVNKGFNVLDTQESAIEGLYALGNCMGDVTAVDYPINVAGNAHGRCITFGYMLGKTLAGK